MKTQINASTRFVTRYEVYAHLDEDGPQPVSRAFSSRRKANRWRYSARTRLAMKIDHERVMGRITGMDEEENMDQHIAQLRNRRVDRRHRPTGWIRTLSVKEQLETLAEFRSDCF